MGTKHLEIYNKIIFSGSIQVERPANIIFLKREAIKMKIESGFAFHDFFCYPLT